MTSICIDLPDGLAREAEQAGLLSPGAIEQLIRDRLQTARVDQLFVAMDRMAGVDEPDAMSPEEVAEEIAALRARRRSSAK